MNICSRQREQAVQRPWGGSIPGVLEVLQGDQCGWRGVRGRVQNDGRGKIEAPGTIVGKALKANVNVLFL